MPEPIPEPLLNASSLAAQTEREAILALIAEARTRWRTRADRADLGRRTRRFLDDAVVAGEILEALIRARNGCERR